MLSPWSLLAVNRDDALPLLLAEQGRGAEGDAAGLRRAGSRQGLSHAAGSPKGAQQQQQLPLLFLFSFHLCYYLPPRGTWFSSGCVTGRQRSITALWRPGEGSSFCSLGPWGGKALSGQICSAASIQSFKHMTAFEELLFGVPVQMCYI